MKKRHKVVTKLFDISFKKNKNEQIFWKEIFQNKINIYNKNGISDWDIRASKRYYQILLCDIKELLEIKNFNGIRSLELGCGTSILSLLMASEGATVYLLDQLQEALDYSKILENQISKSLNFTGKVNYINANFFEIEDLKKTFIDFDIVHNIGVIEEHSPTEAQSIIEIMKKIANKYVIVGVPNFFNPYLLSFWFKNGKANELYYSRGSLCRLMKRLELRETKVVTTSYLYPFKKFTRLEKFTANIGFGFLHLAVATI